MVDKLLDYGANPDVEMVYLRAGGGRYGFKGSVLDSLKSNVYRKEEALSKATLDDSKRKRFEE
ncbi:MAG: hypothetical protein C0609_02620 [Deltaproteobacteria bacterium]|nr:MAG: hypothetical protein C0609_02620 [Deltaproteobacteria bacterium]